MCVTSIATTDDFGTANTPFSFKGFIESVVFDIVTTRYFVTMFKFY